MTKIMKIEVDIQNGSRGANRKVYSARISAPSIISRAIPDFLKPSNHDRKPVTFFPTPLLRMLRRNNMALVSNSRMARTIGNMPGDAYSAPPTSRAMR